MDLFDFNNNEETAKPLAERMRANSLDEFIGQKHIVAEGSLLRRASATDRLGSCIFWGPPGCGKTTLLRDMARQISKVEAVVVVDERGELFPSELFDMGQRLDVLRGCPKKEGIML